MKSKQVFFMLQSVLVPHHSSIHSPSCLTFLQLHDRRRQHPERNSSKSHLTSWLHNNWALNAQLLFKLIVLLNDAAGMSSLIVCLLDSATRSLSFGCCVMLDVDCWLVVRNFLVSFWWSDHETHSFSLWPSLLLSQLYNQSSSSAQCPSPINHNDVKWWILCILSFYTKLTQTSEIILQSTGPRTKLFQSTLH